ncbi:helix-turn-helix domain-containing protein [Nitrospira sp. BLG_2]|uniref:helix-turn-helix domain-containing protein n=1 Tax=Nitrospira sp. BLG_2 TaxID=3397507 RepID=UPI003B9C6B1E
MTDGGVDVRLLGQHLNRVRKERRKRLTEVHEATGISVASLSRIERGGSQSVDAKTLIALCDWMKVSMDQFKENPSVPRSPGKSGQKPVGTPDAVELHLRADKNLDRSTADALSKLFRTAYEQMSKKS